MDLCVLLVDFFPFLFGFVFSAVSCLVRLSLVVAVVLLSLLFFLYRAGSWWPFSLSILPL